MESLDEKCEILQSVLLSNPATLANGFEVPRNNHSQYPLYPEIPEHHLRFHPGRPAPRPPVQLQSSKGEELCLTNLSGTRVPEITGRVQEHGEQSLLFTISRHQACQSVE
jgi:hypothetical protein